MVSQFSSLLRTFFFIEDTCLLEKAFIDLVVICVQTFRHSNEITRRYARTVWPYCDAAEQPNSYLHMQ